MSILITEVSESIRNKLSKVFPRPECFIEVNPGNVLLPRKYAEIAQQISNFEVRSDDIWLISYPRTGSTWTQEMIWLLANDIDFDGAKQKPQLLRAPVLELTALFSEDHHEWVTNTMENSVKCIENLPSPRCIRSHLPLSLLPTDLSVVKPKIIYTSRNPKDLCISLYYHFQLVHGLNGSFEDFCDLFMSDTTLLGPYWKHLIDFWNIRHHNNVLFLKYEDMNRNLTETIEKCGKFLNIDYQLNPEQMEMLQDHLNFDRMRKNQSVNLEPIINNSRVNDESKNLNFIRKGQIGDWKNHDTKNNLFQNIDQWFDNHTNKSDIRFEDE